MLTLQIENDGTGTYDYGNFCFEAAINGQVIARGQVKCFERRERNWYELIGIIADALTAKFGAGSSTPDQEFIAVGSPADRKELDKTFGEALAKWTSK